MTLAAAASAARAGDASHAGNLADIDNASVTDAGAVAAALEVDIETGLSIQEAARRLAQDGPNELRAAPRPPTWRRVLAQFQDPLIYLLLAAVAIALVAWWVEGRVGWPVDAIVIAAVVLLNGVIGHVQEAKAQNAVAALARMTAATATVLREGKPQRVPSAELVRGDVLVLAEGDAVGADARLLQATALRVQEAALTGESEAVLKASATLPAPAALGDQLDMVFKGTAVVQGTGRAVVTATGMDTQMGQVAALLESTVEAPTPLEKEVARVGRTLGIAVVIIAVVVVATILLVSHVRNTADVVHVLLLGVSLAVAAVPEGLPAILAVVLALGVQRMARHHAIVKNLSSVETLGSASVICSDKTGTLTRSEMTIERVMTASGDTRISGVGYAPEGQVHQVEHGRPRGGRSARTRTVEAVREGRAILDNIRKFLRYLLSSNMGEVLTIFLGVVGAGVIGLDSAGAGAGGVVLPLLATQLLWINLITDSAPALAIGVDPPTDDLMARQPRHVNDRLIDARMWASVIQTGVVIAVVTLLTMDYYLPGGLIAGTADLTTARTAGFTVLVFTSLYTCFTARSDTTSAFVHLFVNPWLWGAVALSLLLQVAVVHVPFLNLAFGTAPLALDQWLACAGMASVVLIYSELQKLVSRRWGR